MRGKNVKKSYPNFLSGRRMVVKIKGRDSGQKLAANHPLTGKEQQNNNIRP